MTGPRRSQRLQAGRPSNAGTDSDSIKPTVERDSEVNRTPKTKKRKIDHEKKNTRKKTGQLQSMLDMPLDIVLEICSYLHPKDLLHLARSTKGLRRFFMSKESLPFWKAARLAATEPRLPPCPEDMCEPAFINLLLDTHCHNCSKPNCQDVYLACRVRLCKACFAKKSIPVDDCNLIIDAETLQIIEPCELQDVVPTLRRSWRDTNSFYAPQLESFFVELTLTPLNKQAEYLTAREKLVSSLQDIKALSKFLDDLTHSRIKELNIVRNTRIRDIVKNLREEGYTEEVEWMKKTYSIARNFTRLPAVRKSQPLTPRVWKNIQGPIIEHMENMRRRRLYSVKRKTLSARLKIAEVIVQDLATSLSGHRSKKFILAAAVSIREIYDLLHPGSGDTDTDTGMDVDELRRAFQELVPPFLESRDREIKEYFVQQTRARLSLDETTDPFALALASWFTCRHCHTSLLLPHALNHICPRLWGISHNIRPEWMSAEDIKLLVDAHLDLKWYHHPLPMDIVTDKGTKRTEMAIEACGFDPKCATAEELDEADVRIQCLACEPKETGIPIMNWRTAAQHRCYDAEIPRFARATEQQVAAAQSLWDAARNSSEEKWEKENAFSCAHCTEVSRKPLQDVKFHLFLSHEIADVTANDYVDEHTTVNAPEPVYLISRKELSKRWLRRFEDIVCFRKLVNF